MLNNWDRNLKRLLNKEKVNLILFGETHGFLQDNLIQEEIIKSFQPEIFVYEMLEEESLLTKKEQEDFLKKENEENFSKISTYQELKPTVELAKKYNLPIIGNDIKDMCRKDKDFFKKTNLSNKELKKEEQILFSREKRQVEKIRSLLRKNKKIFATVGAFHLRENSPLRNFKENYLVICPVYNGKPFFEPPKSFDEKRVSLELIEIFNNK